MKIDKRFMFSGHAIGVSAHFHRLDDVHNLNHFIPTLGSSVLSPVGGRSHHEVKNFFYTVDEPRRRILLSAQHVEATAHGSETDDQFETETHVLVRGVSVLESELVGLLPADALVHLGRDYLRFGRLDPSAVLETRLLEAALEA